MKKLAAIRGATCTQNTAEAITKDVCAMCNEIFLRNKIEAQDIVSIQFTVTQDLTELNPATALRKGNCIIDITEPALFCSLEPPVKNSLPLTVRVMITAYKKSNIKKTNVYLNGAEKLRPDYKK